MPNNVGMPKNDTTPANVSVPNNVIHKMVFGTFGHQFIYAISIFLHLHTKDFRFVDALISPFNALYSFIVQNKKLDLYLLFCTSGRLGICLFLV